LYWILHLYVLRMFDHYCIEYPIVLNITFICIHITCMTCICIHMTCVRTLLHWTFYIFDCRMWQQDPILDVQQSQIV
jgi:hypothetical protein